MDIRNDSRWVSGVVDGWQTSDGPLEAGTTFQYRMKVFGLPAKSHLHVTGHDEPHWHEAEIQSGPMLLKAAYSLQSEGESTLLTMNMSARLRLVMRPLSPLLFRMLDRQWKANSLRLKSLLEGDSSSRLSSVGSAE